MRPCRQLPAGVTTEPSSFTILIVDDDEPTQNLLRAVLRRCGYASDVASNGRQRSTCYERNGTPRWFST